MSKNFLWGFIFLFLGRICIEVRKGFYAALDSLSHGLALLSLGLKTKGIFGTEIGQLLSFISVRFFCLFLFSCVSAFSDNALTISPRYTILTLSVDFSGVFS